MRNMFMLSGFTAAIGLAKLLAGGTLDAIVILLCSLACYVAGCSLEKHRL